MIFCYVICDDRFGDNLGMESNQYSMLKTMKKRKKLATGHSLAPSLVPIVNKFFNSSQNSWFRLHNRDSRLPTGTEALNFSSSVSSPNLMYSYLLQIAACKCGRRDEERKEDEQHWSISLSRGN